jgi:hypothetical protein
MAAVVAIRIGTLCSLRDLRALCLEAPLGARPGLGTTSAMHAARLRAQARLRGDIHATAVCECYR